MYFEIQHHAPQLKKVIDEEHSRLRKMQQKLLEVEKKQERIEERVDNAVELHNSLEERLRNLRSLPGPQKKPLSKAEREFKMELGNFSVSSCINQPESSDLIYKVHPFVAMIGEGMSIWNKDRPWGRLILNLKVSFHGLP